jgi:hypothetical protein
VGSALQQLRHLLRTKHYAYALLLEGEEIAESYRVTTLRSLYIIGVDGRIIYSHEGVNDKNLAALIKKHLKENGVKTVVSTLAG